MSSTTDRAAIKALFQKLERAHVDHDADVIVEAYAQDAVIFDLAPPLGRRGIIETTSPLGLPGGMGQSRSMRATSVLQSTATWRSYPRQQNAQAPRRCRSGYVVPHDDVSSEDKWAMANRLRSLVRAVLHGSELSRRCGSQCLVVAWHEDPS